MRGVVEGHAGRRLVRGQLGRGKSSTQSQYKCLGSLQTDHQSARICRVTRPPLSLRTSASSWLPNTFSIPTMTPGCSSTLSPPLPPPVLPLPPPPTAPVPPAAASASAPAASPLEPLLLPAPGNAAAARPSCCAGAAAAATSGKRCAHDATGATHTVSVSGVQCGWPRSRGSLDRAARSTPGARLAQPPGQRVGCQARGMPVCA